MKVSNEYLQKLSIDLSKLNTLWSSIDIQKDRFVISEKNFLSSNTFQPMLVLTIQDPKEIEKNSPVISEQGLVGRINNIGVLTAEVLLLQDIRSSVPIISGESSLHGILNGKGLDRKGELQFIKKLLILKRVKRFSPQAWEEFIPKAYQLERYLRSLILLIVSS